MLLKIVVIIIVININLFFNPREIFYLVMTIFEFKIIIIIIVLNESCMLSELQSMHA